jgi:hypothetical protein
MNNMIRWGKNDQGPLEMLKNLTPEKARSIPVGDDDLARLIQYQRQVAKLTTSLQQYKTSNARIQLLERIDLATARELMDDEALNRLLAETIA